MKPYSTHSKTFSDKTKIDVHKLILIASKNKIKLIDIQDINGISKSKKHGFSKQRFENANYQFPVIIDEKNFLIDGRHRVLKAISQNQKQISCIIVTQDQIEKSKYINDDDLIPYSKITSLQSSPIHL